MKRARRDPIVLGLLLILAVCAIPGVVIRGSCCWS